MQVPTVGENRAEMIEILTEGLKNGDRFAVRLVKRYGSIEKAVDEMHPI